MVLWVTTALCVLATVVAPTVAATSLYTWSTIPVAMGPFAMMWRLAWRRRDDDVEGRAWWCVAIATSASFFGEIAWFIAWAQTGEAPASGLHDVLGLAFGPVMLIALLFLPVRGGSRTPLGPVLLDATLLTAATATVLHGLAVLMREQPGGAAMATALQSFLTLSDGATLGALALVWVRERGGMPRPALRWIAMALAISAFGDVWFAIDPDRRLAALPMIVQGTWYLFWAALGTAAVCATRVAAAPASTPDTAARLRVSRAPYVMALAAYTTLVAVVWSKRFEGLPGVTVGVGVVTLVVLLRQWLASRDVTALLAERVRAGADERLAALVRHGSDMVTILDPDTTVRYASPSHFSVVGIPAQMLVGRRMDEQIHHDDLPAAQRGFERLLAGESSRESLIVRLRDGAGTWRWIEAVGTNLLHEPSIGGLVLNSRDITDRKRLEAQLTEQARRDPLTGLGNRRLFTDRVQHALERRHRHAHPVAVLFCDLDHFKLVNDTLGHARGDALLVAVAERLHSVVRAGDTVARLGGDEFAILLEDLDQPQDAEETGTRLLSALSAPFNLDGREVFVGASVGVAVARGGQTVDDLVTDADVAMYVAKARGRGRVERFSSTMRTSIAERVELEADLRRALEREELMLLYQPVIDLVTGEISGAEGLIRWVHPEHGVIAPGRFIPVAEESELISEIGRYALRRGALDAARFRAITPAVSRMRVAINLSARHLLSPTIERDVLDALAHAGITGKAMAVELTESMLAANEAVMSQRLQTLREHGLTIALDDFGTGYSSLAYLRRFPIDVLKIDKSFVANMVLHEPSAAVTRAIISIGQSLGMRTIAEGVETDTQLDAVRAMGCSIAQGYLLGRPMTADALAELLASWDPTRYAAPATLPALLTAA